MIRQTINCDICSAEKQATSYWFVAYETAGEITLRGWEAPTKSRKNAKHLCGQKCVQRLMSSFTASVMVTHPHGPDTAKDAASESYEPAVAHVPLPSLAIDSLAGEAHPAARRDRADRGDRSELPMPRLHIDPEVVAAAEAESWAGPARPKENLWDMPIKPKVERESFLHARTKASTNGNSRLHKMA